MKLGAQLYSLREFCQDLPGLRESLRRVADMGYSTVQLSGTCDFDANWMKEELDRNGLSCVVTHTKTAKLNGDLEKVCDDHAIFGCKNIGLGHYDFKTCDLEKAYSEFLRIYKPVAQTIQGHGMYFMYHNHNADFRKLNGQVLLRKMAQDFSPQEMGFILDTFWIQAGGANPVEYIREFAGRIPCIHLKDFAYTNEPGYINNISAIGDGNINFEAVITAAADSGVEFLLVEQDIFHGEDPFVCMQRSYDYLKSLGLD